MKEFLKDIFLEPSTYSGGNSVKPVWILVGILSGFIGLFYFLWIMVEKSHQEAVDQCNQICEMNKDHGLFASHYGCMCETPEGSVYPMMPSR